MLFALGTGRIRTRPREQNASVGVGVLLREISSDKIEERVLQSIVKLYVQRNVGEAGRSIKH
jgi:hypothetical protein